MKKHWGESYLYEAYSLSKGGEKDFGLESIDTLIKLMEDYRDKIVIIVAGYVEEMKQFLRTNPGLNSRFPTVLHFEDYTSIEMVEIFQKYCQEQKLIVENDANILLEEKLKQLSLESEIKGNARDVRNFFEKVEKKQASRLNALLNVTESDLLTITKQDINI